MSLYDDMDAIKQKSEQVAGWSSGIKLLQSQLQLKKAVQTQVMWCISYLGLSETRRFVILTDFQLHFSICH
jgi:hypothetical protein